MTRPASSPPPSPAGSSSAPLLHPYFRSLGRRPGCGPRRLQIETRSSRPEYAKLSSELQAMFCECRLQLVGDIVEARIHQLSSLPVPALTRNGCAYLMQVHKGGRPPHGPHRRGVMPPGRLPAQPLLWPLINSPNSIETEENIERQKDEPTPNKESHTNDNLW